MPSVTGANSNMRKPIPLRAKFSRRFYEPILLEVALNKILPSDPSATQHEPNVISDNVDGGEQTFKSFVNRLAQVCDNRRGENGATVTGIAVLEEPEGVHYIIGSNNRKASELQEVELFVKQLLNIAAKSTERPADSGFPVHREVLWHILKFDKNRVKYYLDSTVFYLLLCIEDFDRHHSEEPLASEEAKFKTQLIELKELLIKFKLEEDDKLEGPQYFAACENLFLFIKSDERRKFRHSISERAKDGNMDISKPWMELRHLVGRLHSYYLAVEAIIRAARLWKRLCHDIRVTVIPSATLIPHPLSKKRPVAYEIVGRMTSSEDLMARHRAQADELQQRHSLDEKLLTECNDASQTHMVHAEVLVLDYVLKYLRDSGDAGFWNKWRYIGGSKPTCRLCNYYFAAHPDGVQVRESHNNLYPHWRAPDVFDNATMSTTEGLLNAIIRKTRADAIRSLESQISRVRPHDSSTPTRVSELGSLFASMVLIPPTIEEEDGPNTAIEEENVRNAAGELDDEEEEGRIVFRGRKSLSPQS